MKNSIVFILVLSLLVTSCQTTPRNPASAPTESCSTESRAPASAYCQDIFAATSEVAAPKRPEAETPLTRKEVQDRLIEVTNKELSAKEIARLWEPLTYERDWNRVHDDAFWASLIGRERLEDARNQGVHPVTVFGETTSFNWQASLRRLDQIPVGEFKMNLNLVSDVNRDIHSATISHMGFLEGSQKSKRFSYPDRLRALINKYYPSYGGTFRRSSLYNLHNVLKPFSEAEYTNIMANAEISGISLVEMPWSRPGKRYGIFKYPSTEVYRAKLESLLTETNGRIAAIRDGRSKEDPIDLAAEFQWRFVQIHPLVNGNGRTGRALMTRLLAEFGLPPSSRRMIDVDYTLSFQEQKDLVREGVIESIRLAAAPTKGDNARITAYRRGFGTRLTTKEIQSMTKDLITKKRITNLLSLFPQSREQILTLGGKKFTLGDDLMLIDQYGIPHAARFLSGEYQLVPIADKTYTLLGWGGRYNGVKGLQRDLNSHLEAVMRTNIEFLRKVENDPALASRTRIERYETIERANQRDEYQFHEWEIPLLLEVTKIKEDPIKEPMAVLVQNRGDRTDNPRAGRDYVEKAFFNDRKSVETPELIGHYLLMDQRFHELQRFVENPSSNHLRKPELQKLLLSQIAESRQKLHTATRVMIKPFIQEVARMTPETREYLMQHPQFRLVYEYFIRTPLAFESLAEAGRHLDLGKTVVLRSAAGSRVALTGFMSDRQVRDAVWSIPFIGPRFETFLRNVAAEHKRMAVLTAEKPTAAALAQAKAQANAPPIARLVAKFTQNNQSAKNAIRALLEYVFVQPYADRTLDPESSRAFVTQYLHTQLDVGPKETLSTTANPSYLLADKGETFEAKFAWQDATIYIIEVPRENLRVDTSSGFIVQQEVGMKPMGPIAGNRAVQFQLKADQMNTFFLPKAPVTPEATRVIEMLREVPLKEAETPNQGRFERPRPTIVVAQLLSAGF